MTVTRAGTWVVALVVGVVYGVAGTIGQAAGWSWFPVGLIVAIVGAAAIVSAVRLLTADRWSALATGLGLMLATLVFSSAGPGGSVIVPQPVDGTVSTGIVWTLAVPIITAIVVAWPAVSAQTPAAAPRDPSP